jgi:hypothetical protein
MHHIPQYFFMWFHFAPQTGEPAIAPPNPTTGALRRTIGSCGAIGWWCQKPAHGERWQSQWRVGWQRLILVVVCCVFCVVVVTSFTLTYSYSGREAKIGPAKTAVFSALITKNASLDAPNRVSWKMKSAVYLFVHLLIFCFGGKNRQI